MRALIDDHVLPAFKGRVIAVDTVVAQRRAKLDVPPTAALGSSR
jgi:hypothetical protein